MKKYERPLILAAAQLSEGVYMLSGGEQYTAGEVLEAATDPNTEPAQGDATAGVEGSVGETPETDTAGEGENGSETAEMPQTESAETPETAAETTGSTPETTESAETAADVPAADTEEVGDMQGSMLINCDSRYMNGVWQAPSAGPWGELRKGCQEVLGCSGCPADKGDGCGLQDAGAGSRYFRQIGSLKPGWEASGKLPTDSPYGI